MESYVDDRELEISILSNIKKKDHMQLHQNIYE